MDPNEPHGWRGVLFAIGFILFFVLLSALMYWAGAHLTTVP